MDGLDYEYRTGIGTDIHRLVPERPLMLGGVQVPFELGLLGHSDGDAVLHAVIDAMLGAAGLGDIGMLFPDTDPQWKDADSSELVMRAREQVKKHQWEVVNLDVVIHAQLPRLGPFKGQIKRQVAGLLETDFANVNIKAKTNEGLDAVGRGEAIAATAVIMLRRRIKRRL
ncbi:MAG TPA: 2-C-methyl-D-erythritol 2,4-cyclodiphosphate synthase [Anaerohalosphaeraceae bacterium]|nr:2-C-methyl-D-erythritol 2,4-cyclodiphosphate synthase [Anaerohalosphaeraceae bacterium]HOL32543.1 2-C-methyl-D-erythritol 2,4-cyclodiphosphate synthase [Anaerohalosphaeraceae bacterium]HOM75531.1 2-C-methyl-D-erythritol 2,4-cyclodiphosphate synthase [Anaerohalosphaeraceae bacterium]HPC64736.1 2-C-methyl-D-erythritol 2,4-cyclodiphosphate synthase [Anaerohalosphaeraceae bacterium]HRS70679.1 2-C-methyl-D-erythritol 2,4-cyclodiphosphate synthase [Anaerohalosphaeraceae bacterium]